jgi:hypothetical protein
MVTVGTDRPAIGSIAGREATFWTCYNWKRVGAGIRPALLR